MKKVSTAATKQTHNFGEQKLTIGLDLGDRSSWYCMLDRSAVAEPGEASQRESASGSDGDPGTSWTGASADGTGQHGPRTGQELRREVARVQRAQYESGESRGAESGTANRTG